MAAPALIRLRDVSFTYRGGAKPALCGVNLEVAPGEFVVVMGASGAGKTTLAKCLTRIVPTFHRGEIEGTVEIDGQSLAYTSVSDLAGVVGLVSQDFEAQLFATNVEQEVAFGMEQLGVPRGEMEGRLRQALDVVGLAGFERRDPVSLSGGEKQRLAIAAVIAMRPRILVFDEPTTDLDPQGKRQVFDILARLRGEGFTVVLVEHEIDAAEWADRLILMCEGRIVAEGPCEQMRGQVALLEENGVRAADLDRLARAVGHRGRFASLDQAAHTLAGLVAPHAAAVAGGPLKGGRPSRRRFAPPAHEPAGTTPLFPPLPRGEKGGFMGAPTRHLAGRVSQDERQEDLSSMGKRAHAEACPEPRRRELRRSVSKHVLRFIEGHERVLLRAADNGPPLLALDEVTFAYQADSPVLSGVSLEIRQGEFVALIGQNGSGKTTLAKHLNGLLRPSSGSLRLCDEDLVRLPLERVARDVGYVFQDPDQQIFAATVMEEVEFALRNFGVDTQQIEARTRDALGAVGLLGSQSEDPFLLGKGQRQRLALASLLALRPRVLILDEPTTGLDYREQRRVMDLLRQLHRQGMTIVVITHSPWLVAEYALRGILMSAGRVLFDGALPALFSEPELLERCHFRVPDATRLCLLLGIEPRSVEELIAGLAPKSEV